MNSIAGLEEAVKIDGWMSVEELSYLGSKAAQARSVLQVGCYKGRSSYVIGMNVKDSLTDIDSFIGDYGNTMNKEELIACYKHNVRLLLGSKITLIVGNSHDLLTNLTNSYDMIFIDGSHSYEDVRKDVMLAIPLLNPGGLLCGHDYAHSPEVKRAIDEVFQGNAQLVQNTSIWFMQDDGSLKKYIAENHSASLKPIAGFRDHKLHLGCGAKKLPGYINIDLYHPNADLQLDITCLSPFPDNSMDEIYLNAVFEHLYPFQQKKALSEWNRVLKPGGILKIDSTPDFDEVAKAYIHKAKGNTRTTFDLEEVMRYTHGEYGEKDKIGGIHKDLFTRAKMQKLLEENGFNVARIESVRWGNEPNPVNINITALKPATESQRTSKDASFGAVYCVYDDYVWLPESFESIYKACTAIYFLVSDRPWQGQAADNRETIACIKALPDPEGKVKLVEGSWANETDQRNAGLDLLDRAGIDYCFVVDADEIYDLSHLARMMSFASKQNTVVCWHMTWDTYWKSQEFVITPREPFKPIVFVKVGAARFTQNRNAGGESHGYIPPEVGFCHHMSYARNDQQIYKKITTFSHAHEIQAGWFKNVWKQWDVDHSLTNLHPTHPQAYHRAVRQSINALPPVLQKRFLPQQLTPSNMKLSVISIIILTYNQLRYTKECVESIRKYTSEPHEIIFVDNASSDGTVKYLRKLVQSNPNYRLIENKENHGFARGNNQGIAAASGEYIVLLNNDVVVTESWLSGMLECLNRSLETGIVGPMTNNISGPQKVESADYKSINQLQEYAKKFRERNRHRRIPLRRIVGFCMLFRQSLIERVGLLDENFGSGNFEDDDYCLRTVLLGHQNYIAGDVFIHHYGSRSFVGNKIDYGSALAGNRIIFSRKWSGIDAQSLLGRSLLIVNVLEKAAELYQLGQADKAIEMLLAGIKEHPKEISLYYLLVELLIDSKQFMDALAVLNEMPSEDKDLRRLNLSGYCKESLELFDEAQVYAEQVLENDASSAPALNLKGILAYKRGNRDEAEPLFQAAIEADSSFGEPCTNLGVLQWAKGHHDEAIRLLERGFILSPTVMDVVTAYHTAVTASGLFERAEQVFREARNCYPLNKRISFLLIDVLIKQNMFSVAMQEVEQAMMQFGIDDGILTAALSIRNNIGPLQIDTASKRKGALSLCMIVKNEEQHLVKCLMKIKPVVQEMIVVDTGSNDRSKNIAIAFGAKVFDHPWRSDFATARNFSLSKATGDWILVLDADEVISPQDHIKLASLVSKRPNEKAAYSFTTRNYILPVQTAGWTANDGTYAQEEAGTGWFPSYKVRLFPRDSRIQFVNPVHELLEPSLHKNSIPIKACDIPIHHYGKLDAVKDIAKGEEYYILGRKKLQESGETISALRELAIQAGGLKKYDEAIDLWRRLLNHQPDMALAYLNLGSIYLELERYEEALLASKKAVELAPTMKEATYNYALSQLYTGNIELTIEILEELEQRAPDYPSCKTLLAVAHCCAGRPERTVDFLRKLNGLSFNFADIIYKVAGKLASAGRIDYAIALIDTAIETNNADEKILGLRDKFCEQAVRT